MAPNVAAFAVPGNSDSDPRQGSLFFIGTATVLIRFAGFTILTDPNFLHRGERAYLGYGLQATRITDPALEIGELPPLDLVVLSHMHEDHFDRRAAAQLDPSLPILTSRHAARELRRRGFSESRGLSTWETAVVSGPFGRLRISAMPALHAPYPLALALPPVIGSMLEFELEPGRIAYRIYVSGDTLMHRAIGDIAARFPDIDLGLVHLGGTRVLGVMVTMDGREGRDWVRTVQPHTTIPIHYDDYSRFKSPLDHFRRCIDRAGLADRVHYLARGDEFKFAVAAAWRVDERAAAPAPP